jgi:hypothetical protein
MMFDEITRRVVWEVEGPLTALAVYEISIHAKAHAIEAELILEAHPSDVAVLKAELHKEANYLSGLMEGGFQVDKVHGFNLVQSRDLQEGRWRVSGVLDVSKREWGVGFTPMETERARSYDELMDTLKAVADGEAVIGRLQDAMSWWKRNGYPGLDKNQVWVKPAVTE